MLRLSLITMSNNVPLIVVACGSAAASSHLISEILKEEFKKRKITAQFIEVRVTELPQYTQTKKPALIVVGAGSMPKGGIPPDVPILSGVPLMSGIGAQDFINKVVEIITKRK